MLDRDELNNLIRSLSETRENELGCNECLEKVDRFVEMELAGLDADAAMPLVKDHLDKCGDCREEFEALLYALLKIQGYGPLRRFWISVRRRFKI